MQGFFILIVIVFAAVAIAVGAGFRRRANEAWNAAARRLGLEFTPGKWLSGRNMVGEFRGNGVHVDTYTSGGGNNSQTYTRYRLTYPQPLGLGLKLTNQGFFSGVAKFFGFQDIEVGEADFDAQVVVKGGDPRRVIAFLTPSRRLRIHRLLTALPGCTIGDAQIECSSRGVDRDAEHIVSVVKRMAGLACHLTGEPTDQPTMDRAIDARQGGQLDQALELVRQSTFEQDDDVLDAEVLEGEILYTGGQYQQAADVFEKVRKQVPDDPEVSAWAEQAAKNVEAPPPLPSIAASQSPPAPEPSASPAAAALDVRQVSEALFDSGKMSFEVNRLFEDQYLGRTVQWTGMLQSVDRYTFDLVFGNAPGVKAVLVIHELSGGPYGSAAVQAVVQLPESEADALHDRIGQSVSLRGTLASCDAFMRNIYLTGGRVV